MLPISSAQIEQRTPELALKSRGTSRVLEKKKRAETHFGE